jgi:hypothetical protein
MFSKCFINKYTQGGALMKIAEKSKYQRAQFRIAKNPSCSSKKGWST